MFTLVDARLLKNCLKCANRCRVNEISPLLTCTALFFQNPKMRQRYLRLKEQNEHMLKTLETDQQEIDRLTMKKKELEEVSGFLWTFSIDWCFFK